MRRIRVAWSLFFLFELCVLGYCHYSLTNNTSRMTPLSQTTGYLIIALFGISMLLLTYVFARWSGWKTKEGFLLAERTVGWKLMGPSIAASWIWAGALFVSTQMAYEKGLAGIFWFMAPNFVALAIFAFLGPKIKEKFANGYTLPQYIRHALKSERLHKLYLIPFSFGQLIAVTFNVFAGGALISAITGIPLTIVMPALVLVVMGYALISGLEASIVTDFAQLILMYGALAVIIPWTLTKTGVGAIAGGLGGISGNFGNIFTPEVALRFGIVASIGLISQTISDQQYWQRVFASKRSEIVRAFIFGAILFAVVPLGLSIFGFLAANPGLGIDLTTNLDPSMIGVLTVQQLLPPWALILFVVALLSGLTSTIDSAMAATSSLYAIDIAKYSVQENAALEKQLADQPLSAEESSLLKKLDAKVITRSRFAMVAMAGAGLGLAYALHFLAGFGVKQLFLLSISIAASTASPTVLSLYWARLSARGTFWGIVIAMVLGMPAFFYANYLNDDVLIAASSIFMVGASALICLLMPKKVGTV